MGVSGVIFSHVHIPAGDCQHCKYDFNMHIEDQKHGWKLAGGAQMQFHRGHSWMPPIGRSVSDQ